MNRPSSAAAVPIETHGLTKTYRLGFWMNRNVRALQGVDLKVQPGQVYGLLGPNGAGKSTTIKILMDLVRPTSGQAKVFGSNPDDEGVRRFIGFVPENPAPYEYLTGNEFVRLAGHLSGLSGAELDKRVKEVVSLVGMERGAHLQIRRFSKGMVQRIALAQALIHRPKLLILDEPTSGLDPIGRRKIHDIVLEERERGTTILFCTHVIPDVETLCDRVAVLVAGKLVREGSTRELLTSQVPVMEIYVEGVAEDKIRGLGPDVSDTKRVGDRVVVKAPDLASQRLMRGLLELGGRITHVQPARFSLEDLFLQAVESVQHKGAGAEIS